MKFVLLILTLSTLVFGISGVRLDSSSTNIATSFSNSVKISLASLDKISTIVVDNRTATEIAVNCTSNSSAPSDNDLSNFYVNASQAIALDHVFLGTNCYLRSMGSTISSGIVNIIGYATY